MRHRKTGRRLGRTSAHRKAMFANMAASLFDYERIKTTLPKAKELRRVAEPLITLAKTASVANRRIAFARLRNRAIVGKLFDELAPHFADRPGGYLRILKCGNRAGDNAPMAYVQLVGRDIESAPSEQPAPADARGAKRADKADDKEVVKDAVKDGKDGKDAVKDAVKDGKDGKDAKHAKSQVDAGDSSESESKSESGAESKATKVKGQAKGAPNTAGKPAGVVASKAKGAGKSASANKSASKNQATNKTQSARKTQPNKTAKSKGK